MSPVGALVVNDEARVVGVRRVEPLARRAYEGARDFLLGKYLLPVRGGLCQEGRRHVRLDRLDPVSVGQRERSEDAALLPLVRIAPAVAPRQSELHKRVPYA